MKYNSYFFDIIMIIINLYRYIHKLQIPFFFYLQLKSLNTILFKWLLKYLFSPMAWLEVESHFLSINVIPCAVGSI